ncbi:MAG: glutamate-5-semialdehyde dehydrogenase [Solirubrobacterales bacterium]|nr:glutamate-5-semialdehyde dehydrogenase [Solirubrobacterales bacterium]OJU93295.1 MAG: glutamate-5-semialdehyde dehydrogenase [Solirubrobacterales bacterium 67-14]
MEATATDIATDTITAKSAARAMAAAPTEVKNQALEAIARGLGESVEAILEANAADLADERAQGLSKALTDRLTLTPERVEAMAAGVREVASLDDPVGEVLETSTLENGLQLNKIRVPLGVVAVVYEARPNVTIDCAALTIKSGNSILLKGSSYAERTNTALAEVVRAGLAEAALPENGVVMSVGGGRESIADLATQDGVVDLLIPRGGEGLKKTLEEVATVPVIFAAAGICHVYVHSDANLEMARAVAYNAKVQRPGVCNAAETLLVDSEVAAAFLPPALAELAEGGVELVGDEAARENAGETAVGAATAEDWDTEYLDLKLAVRVVDGLEEAIEHINRHGSGHSDAIVTDNTQAGDLFAQGVDSAAVYVNASTRFTDGFEYGMGAEIGVSTQKLHARGPVGLRELTTIKYVVRGEGQVRG